jgi:hypothetical protein
VHRATGPVQKSDPSTDLNPGNHSRICLQSAQMAQVIPHVPKPLRDMARILTGVLSAPHSRNWMDSADDSAAALGLCDWLAVRIRTGQPTSVIRIGDGEGRFLPYRAGSLDRQADDQAQVQRDPWWGAELIGPSQAQQLSAALVRIIGRADLLGIPPMSRLSAELAWPTALSHRDCRGLTAIFDLLLNQPPRGAVGSCNLHADLDRWDLYGRLLADCKSVSLISCHDLTSFLRHKFGLTTRAFYQIPSEYRYRSRFSGQTAGHMQPDPVARIYPETFDTIMAQLDPTPGEVHLVGAGFLGKFFCDQIRTKGGIAIDIGSQADRWANHATRGYFNLG